MKCFNFTIKPNQVVIRLKCGLQLVIGCGGGVTNESMTFFVFVNNPCDFVIYAKHVDCTMIMRTKTTTNIWWVKPPTDWFCLNKDETFKGSNGLAGSYVF